MIYELPRPTAGRIKSVWHIADLHIRCGSKTDVRMSEYKTAFSEFVAHVKASPHISESVVVICGDVFHKTRLGASGICLFRTLVRDLTEMCPVYVIRGNHDFLKSDPEGTDMVDAFVDDIIVSKGSNIAYLKEGAVYLAGDVGFAVFSESLVPDANLFPSQLRSKIALYHGMIIGARMDHLSSVSNGVSLDVFENYDLGMFGDIHMQQVHNASRSKSPVDTRLYFGRGFAWGYCGSLIQQTFGEIPIKHGALVWDIDERHVTPVLVRGERAYIKAKADESGSWTTDYGEYSVSLAAIGRRLPKYVEFRVACQTNSLNSAFVEYMTKIAPHVVVSGLDVSPVLSLPSLPSSQSSQSIAHAPSNHEVFHSKDDSTLDHVMRNLYTDDPNDPERWKNALALGDESLKAVASMWISAPSKCMPSECIGIPPSGLESVFSSATSKIEGAIDAYDRARSGGDGLRGSTTRIKFDLLEFDWLLCFGAGNTVDFSKLADSIGVIASPNGTGKSALLEIVGLALFGVGHDSRRCEAFTGHVINDRKPPKARAKSSLVFTVVSNETEQAVPRRFRILREFAQQNTERRLLEKTAWMEEWIDGCWESHIPRRNKSSKAAESKVRELVGDERSFFDTAYVAQRGDRDFFDMDVKTQTHLLCSTTNVEQTTSFAQMCDAIASAAASIEKHAQTAVGALKSSMIDATYDEDTTRYLFDQNVQELDAHCRARDTLVEKLEVIKSEFGEFDDALLALTPDEVVQCVEHLSSACGSESWSLTDEMELDYYKCMTKDVDAYGTTCSMLSDTGTVCDKACIESLLDTLQRSYRAKCSLFLDAPCEMRFSTEDGSYVHVLMRTKTQMMQLESVCSDLTRQLTELQTEIDELESRGVSTVLDIEECVAPEISVETCRMMQSWYTASNVTDEQVAKVESRVAARSRAREIQCEIDRIVLHICELEQTRFNTACECCMAHPDHLRLQESKATLDRLVVDAKDVRAQFADFDAIQDDIWLVRYNEWTSTEYARIEDEWKCYTEYTNQKKLKMLYDRRTGMKERQDQVHANIAELPSLEVVEALIAKKDELVELAALNSECKSVLKTVYDARTEFRGHIARACTKRLRKKVQKLEYTRDVSVEASRTDGVRAHVDRKRVVLQQLYERIKDFGACTPKSTIECLACEVDRANIRKAELSSNGRVLQERISALESHARRVDALVEYGSKVRCVRDVAKKFQERMTEYRVNIFEQCVLPRFVSLVNAISASSTQNCVLHASIFRNAPSWALRSRGGGSGEGGGYIRVEKASGFQRATIGLSAKIALSLLSHTSRYNTLFIDEGFVACDDDHLARIPSFLTKLLGVYGSLVLVTHLEGLRDSVNGKNVRITYDDVGNSRVSV